MLKPRPLIVITESPFSLASDDGSAGEVEIDVTFGAGT